MAQSDISIGLKQEIDTPQAQLADAKDIIASLKDEITLMKHERAGLVEAGRILANAVLYTRKTLCPECRGICAARIIGKAVGIASQESKHALPGKPGETGDDWVDAEMDTGKPGEGEGG